MQRYWYRRPSSSSRGGLGFGSLGLFFIFFYFCLVSMGEYFVLRFVLLSLLDSPIPSPIHAFESPTPVYCLHFPVTACESVSLESHPLLHTPALDQPLELCAACRHCCRYLLVNPLQP